MENLLWNALLVYEEGDGNQLSSEMYYYFVMKFMKNLNQNMSGVAKKKNPGGNFSAVDHLGYV